MFRTLPTRLRAFGLRAVAGLLLAGLGGMTRSGEQAPAKKAEATLREYRGAVLTLAFSPDGKTLATGGGELTKDGLRGEVTLWDLAIGRPRWAPQQVGTVFSLAFSPDGKRLATGSYRGANVSSLSAKIALWDAASGKEILTLKGYAWNAQVAEAFLGFLMMGLTQVAFSPDGKVLATAGADYVNETTIGVLQLWDAGTGREVRAVKGRHTDLSGPLTFLADGTLATSGADVSLWDVARGKRRATLKARQTNLPVRSLAFSQDGKLLAWAAASLMPKGSELSVWEVATGKRVAVLRGHKGAVFAVALSPDGKTLASGGEDGAVRLWDVATLRERAVLRGPTAGGTVHALAFSPDGKTLAAGTTVGDFIGGAVALWDTATLKPWFAPAQVAERSHEETERQRRLTELRRVREERERRRREEEGRLTDGQRALLQAARAEARRHLYALQLQRAQRELERGHLEAARALLEAQRPRPGEEDLRDFAWRYLRGLCRFRTRTLGHEARVALARLSPDGKTLAAASDDRTVTLWDVPSGKRLAALETSGEPVNFLTFSPDSKCLALTMGEENEPGSHDVHIWDARTGEPLGKLKGHQGAVKCLAFAADSKSLVTGSMDETVRLWDVPAGKAARVLGRHGAEILAVAFSPDGKAVASGGLDATTHLWDVAAGKIRASFKEARGDRVGALFFSPDGKRLLAVEGGELHRPGSAEYSPTKAKLWDISAGNKAAPLNCWPWMARALFSPDGKLLALSGWEEGVLWDLAAGKAVVKLPAGSRSGTCMAFAPDGKSLLIGIGFLHDPVSRLRLYDAWDGKEMRHFEGRFGKVSDVRLAEGGKVLAAGAHKDRVGVLDALLAAGWTSPELGSRHGSVEVAFPPRGSRVAVCINGMSVFLFDSRTGRKQLVFEPKVFSISQVAFVDGGKAVVVCYPGPLKCFDAATGKERASLTGTKYGAVSADGRTVVTARADGEVSLWDPASGKIRGTLKRPATAQPAAGESLEVGKLWISPGGKWVAGMTWGGVIVLWDARAGKVLKVWQRQVTPAGLAFSPDEKAVLTVHEDGSARLWDLPAVKERAVLPGKWDVGRSAFAPDGKTVALAGPGSDVTLAAADTGEERTRLRGHFLPVTRIRFTPDGREVLTGSQDGEVRIWDPVTGQERLTLAGHARGIICLTFDEEGAMLATGDDNGALRLWRAPREMSPTPPERP